MTPKDKKNYAKISGVAGRIAQAILESGKSQAEIANKMGIFPTAISRWKTGTTEPTPANINALAKILGTDVNWLMSGKTSENLTNYNYGEQEMIYQKKYEALMEKYCELQEKNTLMLEQMLKMNAVKKARPLGKEKMA